MKITLRELKACERGLIKLVNSDLPARISFRLTHILKEVRDNLQHVDKIRTDLIIKHGAIQQDGTTRIEHDSEGETRFKEEFESLLNESITIDNYIHLTLEDIAEATISAVELEPLIGNFIKPQQIVNTDTI